MASTSHRRLVDGLSGDGRAVGADVLEDAFIAAIDRVWQAKTAVQQWQGTGETEWIQIWDETLTAVGLRERISPNDATSLYRTEVGQTHELYPDVMPALEALVGRFKLAIITNGGSTMQREKIEPTGLAPFVDANPRVRRVGSGQARSADLRARALNARRAAPPGRPRG